jgi:UDP-3-O-[3-hydroxymyristoyl] glucosamine N-acyltransferase
MKISINELAQLLKGKVEGDGTQQVHTVCKIEEGTAGALSFLANTKYEEHIYTTQATAVLVNKEFTPSKLVQTTLIRVDNAYEAFTYLLEKFSGASQSLKGIEANSFVEPSAVLGKDVYLGAFSYVSKNVEIGDNSKVYPQVFLGADVKIGKNCILYPGVKIYYGCELGDNCIIHAGTIIGSDGFGFAPLADRSYKKIPQTGNVVIENNVEIGANCAIDRATMGTTRIQEGAKLDNLIQIAHNVVVGKHSVMAGQSGIAGSAKLGSYCAVGGQVAIAGHITIADGNQFGGQSGVLGSIKEVDGKWFGTPAFEVKDYLKATAIFRKLPELQKRLNALENELKQLKGE